MLVKYWMRPPVTFINVNDSLEHVAECMKEYFVTLLPVVKSGRLVGVLRDTDLSKALSSHALMPKHGDAGAVHPPPTVGRIMTRNPVTVPPDFTLEEAAALLLLSKTDEAPVVGTNSQVLGFISQQDILWALMTLNGFESRGVQCALEVVESSGVIQEIVDIVRSYQGRLASSLTSLARASAGSKRVYLRIHGIDRQRMPELKRALSAKASLLYLIDHRENTREEYESVARFP